VDVGELHIHRGKIMGFAINRVPTLRADGTHHLRQPTRLALCYFMGKVEILSFQSSVQCECSVSLILIFLVLSFVSDYMMFFFSSVSLSFWVSFGLPEYGKKEYKAFSADYDMRN
jgi:hypothetical protein